MRVRILYGYRGPLTGEQYWPVGEVDVNDSAAAYLIENGHAAAVNSPFVPTIDSRPGDLRPLSPLVTAPGGPVVVPPVDLSALTKAQLIELAASRGITLSDRLTKTQMIEALE